MGERVVRETTPLPVESSENINSYSIAQAQLFARSIPVLPDILTNSGGVTVSYFEWVQNIENERWSEDQVNAHLRTKMEAATDAVLQTQLEIKDRHAASVDLRTAAFVTAIKRVSNVALARGIWP